MENNDIKNKETGKIEKFFKKYWHIIVIVILLLFGMNQCARSCSRNRQISKKNIEITVKDSIINALCTEIDTLKNNVNYYSALFESEKNHNSSFASIATGNQTELYNKITELDKQTIDLENQLKKLKNDNAKLSREIVILKDSLNTFKNK